MPSGNLVVAQLVEQDVPAASPAIGGLHLAGDDVDQRRRPRAVRPDATRSSPTSMKNVRSFSALKP
jgi:hypothetical protein